MNMMGDIIQKTIQNREENNIQRNDFLQMLMQLQKTGELEGEENGLSPISRELNWISLLMSCINYNLLITTHQFDIYSYFFRQES